MLRSLAWCLSLGAAASADGWDRSSFLLLCLRVTLPISLIPSWCGSLSAVAWRQPRFPRHMLVAECAPGLLLSFTNVPECRAQGIAQDLLQAIGNYVK